MLPLAENNIFQSLLNSQRTFWNLGSNCNVIFSDENNSIGEEPNYKGVGAFVGSRRESLIPSDSDQLIPNVPFGSLLSAKASQQQSPTNAVNGHDLCERLKAIDFDKDDQNGNVTVTKSATSNNDFILVDLVVSF